MSMMQSKRRKTYWQELLDALSRDSRTTGIAQSIHRVMWECPGARCFLHFSGSPGRSDLPWQRAFDFLGFTFYWGKARQGFAIPKVKTTGKRLRVKLKRVNAWARAVQSRYPLVRLVGVLHQVTGARSVLWGVLQHQGGANLPDACHTDPVQMTESA